MVLVENLAFFILSALVLVVAGSLLVRSLSKIAAFLRMSEFVVGFVIMAFATSIPELFVGISSAIAKQPALALGTVIGSNIADLALVGGIIAILGRKIDVKSKYIRINAIWMVALATLPMVLMFIGKGLTRADGIVLVIAFLSYVYYLLKKRRRPAKVEDSVSRWQALTSPVIFFIALGLLFVSAKYLVQFGSALASDLFVPPLLIGLFFVAIGTSLPELVFGTAAVLKHHPNMVIGTLIGSVVANSTLVLGITAIISPITADFVLWLVSAIFMIVITFTFMAFIYSGKKLDWREGISLLLLFFLFVIVELTIKGVIR